MKFSVITVSYNSEDTIQKTMESVLCQDVNDIEYIVVDGKSTDRTVAVSEKMRLPMEKKGIILRISSEKDEGIYDAMNKGIEMATGDVISFLNTGDVYEPGALKKVKEIFEKEDCDYLFGSVRMRKANGTSFIKKARVRSFETSRDWNHPTSFVKAKILKENRFLNKGIHDDYGLYLHLKKLGIKIVTTDSVLAQFGMGGVSNAKGLKKSLGRIRDRYKYCYRVNGYSRFYIIECVAIELAKLILG
ncbi:MAG: glycosyltransferase [Lachnospiraceae bacterium]|nr:glycosyltransferase [Lachnospiraceae bacterium]